MIEVACGVGRANSQEAGGGYETHVQNLRSEKYVLVCRDLPRLLLTSTQKNRACATHNVGMIDYYGDLLIPG